MTNDDTPVTDGVVVRDLPIADLSHFTTVEQLATIDRIEDVALVVVPESLAAAYLAIPTRGVATTAYVPDGARVRLHTGTLVVGGDGLGNEDDVLVVIGLLLVTGPVTGPVPRRIHVIGSVLAPRGSESAIGPALAHSTGSVGYYPHVEGQRFKVLSGQVQISGAMLANPAGQPDDLMVVAGQAVITGQVTTVGYRQIIIEGQLSAPAASRDAIEPWIRVDGQAAWYRGDNPRVYFSETTFTADFFRLLDRPVGLIVYGVMGIAADVTEALLLEKVAGITLFGTARVPSALLGVTQALTTDLFGAIQADDGPGN